MTTAPKNSKITLPTGGSALPPGKSHETKFDKPKNNILSQSDVSDSVVNELAARWWKEHGLDVTMMFFQTSLGRPATCLRAYMGRLGLASDWKDQRLGREIERLMMESLRA